MTQKILRIDASANTISSVTRRLTDQVIDRLQPRSVEIRDLASDPLPQIDNAWVAAREVPSDQVTLTDRAVLKQSDDLIAEIKAADTLVIGVPVYNFGIPASLKAWIDLIARASVTFAYTETGPKGLLTGKRAILAVASGGVPVGSDADFATGYMTFMLGFVGITDVTIVAADRMAVDGDASMNNARSQIDSLAA